MNRLLIATSFLIVAFTIALFVYWPRPIAAVIYPNEQLMVAGNIRDYRLVVPHKIPDSAPIVFAYHGIGDSTESMANYSHLDRLASQNGFILVYPAAQRSMWTTIDAGAKDVDANPDVQFFDQLLAYLSKRQQIDRDRVYAVGMSNGASFVQLLANSRPNDIAAIVAHSGTKPRALEPSNSSIPILLIVGTEDNAAFAMQSDADQYRNDGHVVEFVSVSGLAHEWSARHNTSMWQFLSEHSAARNP